jgi:hypothetical protein
MPIVPASAPPPRTGLRLIDDLFGAAPDPNAPRPTQNTIRAATPYETYAQPAVLGLRRAMQGAGHLLGLDDPVQSAMMSVNPLAMAEAPAEAAVSAGARALQGPAEAAMAGLKRAVGGGAEALSGAVEDSVPSVAKILRQNRNATALARYGEQFDPTRMQAIQQFADRNPRIFSTMAIDEGAPAGSTFRADFTPYAEPQGARVGRVRLRATQTGDTSEDFLQALEHEARHAVDAKRMGGLPYAEQTAIESELPYHAQPMEQSAFKVQEQRALERQVANMTGRPLNAAARVGLRGR